MTSKKGIFITGAASGIGRGTALFFAKQGWFVGMFDINDEGLLSLKAEIGDENCCMQQMDVCNFESIKNAVETFTDMSGGQMDVLFNSAGILRMGAYETISIDDQMLIVDVNLKGMLSCINAAFESLKNTKGARIISMSSASAIYGIPELAVYSSTKHAVRGLTEALNIEFEKYDIYVSDIMPGYVNTPMVVDADVKAKSVEKLGVNITPDQVAETVWKAAHQKKIHWGVGGSKLASFLFLVMPFAKRAFIKSSAGF